ncbi:MAG: hypothetical protein OEY23_23355 [Acidimicrobiia bacterium]|nr:hypothetical protein [Acidimicrobiia bacterium]
MSKASLERQLAEGTDRLRRLREDLRIADEQLLHFADEAEDLRIRATVSDSPMAQREHRDAARHAQAMTKHRDDLRAEIGRLETRQDELLDEYSATSSDR